MISNVDSQRFAMLFRGKTNTYVKNELPKTKPEAGQKIKTHITNNEGTVDKDLLAKHLNGDFGVGICPVNAEGKCFFGCIDIDYYLPKIKRVLSIIKEHQLPLLPFRSKSGGLHVYLFLAKAVSAKTMRETLSNIIYYFSLDVMYGKTKVEIFPKQEKAEGFGSAITLPYFNAEHPYTYLLDLDGDPVPFKEALDYIQHHLQSPPTSLFLFVGLFLGISLWFWLCCRCCRLDIVKIHCNSIFRYRYRNILCDFFDNLLGFRFFDIISNRRYSYLFSI